MTRRTPMQVSIENILDTHRQMMAVYRLRINPKATPAWFRGVVNEIKTDQDQIKMFDLDDLLVATPEAAPEAPPEPPHPSTTVPPRRGRAAKTIIANQVEFWRDAAAQWDALGKPFKRQECDAAADALDLALAAL